VFNISIYQLNVYFKIFLSLSLSLNIYIQLCKRISIYKYVENLVLCIYTQNLSLSNRFKERKLKHTLVFSLSLSLSLSLNIYIYTQLCKRISIYKYIENLVLYTLSLSLSLSLSQFYSIQSLVLYTIFEE
jgi:hypothetical protein